MCGMMTRNTQETVTDQNRRPLWHHCGPVYNYTSFSRQKNERDVFLIAGSSLCFKTSVFAIFRNTSENCFIPSSNLKKMILHILAEPPVDPHVEPVPERNAALFLPPTHPSTSSLCVKVRLPFPFRAPLSVWAAPLSTSRINLEPISNRTRLNMIAFAQTRCC